MAGVRAADEYCFTKDTMTSSRSISFRIGGMFSSASLYLGEACRKKLYPSKSQPLTRGSSCSIGPFPSGLPRSFKTRHAAIINTWAEVMSSSCTTREIDVSIKAQSDCLRVMFATRPAAISANSFSLYGVGTIVFRDFLPIRLFLKLWQTKTQAKRHV